MKNALELQSAAIHCPNCGTLIAGQFCQGCGQPAHLHVPSAREFMHEFIAHYVALEGKLWKSVALLLFRPGRLTRDYIEGKRARYVEPLRLYLSFSIIFFAIFKLSGTQILEVTPNEDTPPAQHASAPVQVKAAAAKGAGNAQARGKKNGNLVTLDDGEENWVQTAAASVHPTLGKKVEHFGKLPLAERNATMQRAFSSYTPYAIFLLMPVFAALLKLLYLGSGRRYGEHLLFALHTNAFAFLMASLVFIVPGFVPLVEAGLFLWLVFYLPAAMHTVYGGSWWLTALRWIVLMTMHILCVVLATLSVAAIAVIA